MYDIPDVSIVILAAGLGTRMKASKAKVLHELCEKTMIEHIVENAFKVSNDINVVVMHQKEAIKEVLKKHPIKFIEQDLENFPGTGGAVKNFTPKHAKIMILNGDMPLIEARTILEIVTQDANFTVGCSTLENPQGYGRVVLKESEIVKVVEQKDASIIEQKINLVNTGIYCLNSNIFNALMPKITNHNVQKEFYITDLIQLAYNEGERISTYKGRSEEFFGVNNKVELNICEEILQKRIKRKWMSQGVTFRLPQTTFIGARVTFEGECEVQNGCYLSGETLIKDSFIKSQSVVENAQIIESHIGPMARIRPKSQLYKTHVGNFVETKNAILNEVKAGHLSYLSDCNVDAQTNIGAGVITCNYDGKAKHQTNIGKNVFVGSDSQLVAPVNIEDDVFIAAGSCVTKNAKKGNLVISRAKQNNKSGFFYKFFGKK